MLQDLAKTKESKHHPVVFPPGKEVERLETLEPVTKTKIICMVDLIQDKFQGSVLNRVALL